MTYLISYDISEPKRLKEIAKFLENTGYRIQESVFQCGLDEEEYPKVRSWLLNHIEKNEGSLMIFPVCAKCIQSVIPLGLPYLFPERERYQIL